MDGRTKVAVICYSATGTAYQMALNGEVPLDDTARSATALTTRRAVQIATALRLGMSAS